MSAAAAKDQPSFLFILGDDIGWADFSYNNGTAHSPRIDEWARADGSIVMQDHHTGGTVCSPTRATVLTGRNHFRDCVNYVYGCSDMSECVPDFHFAPKRTFTFADAARAAGKGYESWFGGKWHLGSFYNDSADLGGFLSSPLSHGFDRMNATVEVAPTATTNCQCRTEWNEHCEFGHYHGPNHCSGGPNPGGPPLKNGCCFNYWWENSSAPHGVSNLSTPSWPVAGQGTDDSAYVADAFIRFVEGRRGAPFAAQISMHNCHIPYIGDPKVKAACAANETCRAPEDGAEPYTDSELDFYACLHEFDASVGRVLDALKRLDYYENTLIWWSGGDNGPEVNCPPDGRCKGTIHRPGQAPGSAGVLRGRKRDVWEGGHRVPGLVSWPAVVHGAARTSWATVVTMDWLPTVMEVLGVDRVPSQAGWALDGKSLLPILRGEAWPTRGIGWMYSKPVAEAANGYGYRFGKWKLAVGGVSCKSDDCKKPQLYDLEAPPPLPSSQQHPRLSSPSFTPVSSPPQADVAEAHDLAAAHPDVLAAITANFSAWFASVHDSIANESACPGSHPSPPPSPFPPSPPPSSACDFKPHTALNGANIASGHVASQEQCCGACLAHDGCAASDFVQASAMRPSWDGEVVGGTCNLKASYDPKGEATGETQTACHPQRGAAA